MPAGAGPGGFEEFDLVGANAPGAAAAIAARSKIKVRMGTPSSVLHEYARQLV